MPRVWVLEENRSAGARVGRIAAAAAGLLPVELADEPAALDPGDAAAVLCDARHVPAVLERLAGAPDVPIVPWVSTHEAVRALVETARSSQRIRHWIGWPAFASIPRASELAMTLRRVLAPQTAAPKLADFASWGAASLKWRPRTVAERESAIAEAVDHLEAIGVSPRATARVAEAAHELLMNAMYDAPVDAAGKARFAHDRKAEIALEESEAPVFRLATDGVLVALETTDPFGGLREEHLFDGLIRGLDSATEGARLDTSNGGAGLGLFVLWSTGIALWADVVEGESSRVTWIHDLDIHPRDYRGLAASVHVVRTAGAGGQSGRAWT